MKHVSKRFLNNSANESGSIVVSAVTPEEGERLSAWSSLDGEVKISDCYKFITLDFSVSSDRQLQNRIDKVQVMIDELTALRDVLRPMWEDIRDRRPEKTKDEDGDNYVRGFTEGD